MKNNFYPSFITCLFAVMLFLTACTPTNPNSPWNKPQSQSGDRTTYSPINDNGTNAGSTTAQTQVKNVALLLPLTGQNAALGQSMLNAAQLALFDFNNPNFNLMPRDTKGTADGARIAAQGALQDGAQIILGPVFADSVRAVQPIAKQRNINVIAFSTDQTLADSSTFLMGLMPSTQASEIALHAIKNNMKRVSIIAPRDAYGDIVTNTFERIIRQRGGTINQIVRYTPNDPELGNNIARMGQNIDAVFMPVGGSDARAISDYLNQNNMPASKVTRLGTGLWDTPQILQTTNLQGGLFAAPSQQNYNRFNQKYQNAYGTSPVRIASLAFDATALAATLTQNAGQRNISNAFATNYITNNNGYAGTDGVFRFGSNGVIERKLSIFKIDNNSAIEITPARNQF